MQALNRAAHWMEADDFLEALTSSGLERAKAVAFLDDALGNSLLQRFAPGAHDEDARAIALNRASASLAQQFLLARSHQQYLDYSLPETCGIEEDLMSAYRSQETPPPIFKDCDRPLKTVTLPAVREALPAVLCDEPDASENAPRDVRWLAEFLRAAVGATATLEDPVQGTLLLKTYPSGGARHPVECYLAVRSVEQLAPGFYHYSVRRHELDRISDIQDSLSTCLFPGFNSELVIVLTALPERAMWRYRETTSISVVLLDVGHAVGNFSLLCECEGTPYRIHTGANLNRAANYMSLEQFREVVVAAIALDLSARAKNGE
ncbi:MAG: SagB/ThcOx family dehydrogenase [Acidobacteriaceae bacterium]|nr:SagB/ThcOx family dehydrogenase [Acidobacteriaceae bacterium]